MLKKVFLVLGIILLVLTGYVYNLARQGAALAGGFNSRTLCTNY